MESKINRQSLYQSIFSVRLSRICIAAFVLLFGIGAEAFAQTGNYTIIDVPGSQSTFADDINDAGDVVGYYDYAYPASHGFKWSNGVFTIIDPPGSTILTTASKINTAGDIIGNYRDTANKDRSYKWSNGVLTIIGAPGGGGNETYVIGINSAGDIIGGYSVFGVGYKGFKLSNGVFTLISPPGSVNNYTRGINNAGDVVGDYSTSGRLYGYKLSNGIFTIIDPPSPSGGFITGTNNIGEVVGQYYDGNKWRSYKWSNGIFTLINSPGSVDTYAYDINDSGTVIGNYFDGNTEHGFKWNNGVFTIIDPPGSDRTYINGINNAGDMVGFYYDANNKAHGFKFTNNNATLTATVQTNPAGRSFTVDGVTYNSTQTFNWQSGAAHTIGTNSPQTGSNGTQYVWSNWSDGGAISHTVSPTSNVTYTANFTDSLPQCIRPNLGYDFGDVLFGTSQEKTFTYTNNLPISFTPQNYTLEGAADYCITSNSCENTLLAPGQSCTWTAKFTARAGGLRINEAFNLFTKPGLSNGSDCKGLAGNGTINPNQITRQYQVSYPSVPYGHCTNAATGYTIKSRGCALTSLTMAINYILASAPASVILPTPPNLQTFALGIGGITKPPVNANFCMKGPGNDVLFDVITNNYPLVTPAAARALEWRDLNIANDSASLVNVLKGGYPVVVAIVHKKNNAACNVSQPSGNCFYNAHYVIAIDENLNVIDPEVTSGPVSLQSVVTRRTVKGAVGWKARGLVKVRDKAFDLPKQVRNCPAGNFTYENSFTAKSNIFNKPFENGNLEITNCDSVLSSGNVTTLQAESVNTANDGSLSVYGNENVDFLVVNSQGNRTGYDSTTQQIVQEIPNSNYYLENITAFDEPTDNLGNSVAQISRPANGSYQVVIKGTQAGQYQVTINRSNRYGQSLTPIIFTGSIQSGETIIRSFTYTSSKNTVDFDKDGNADVSVFRPDNGVWYLNQSQNGFTGAQFGVSTDKLVPADYDGDGKTDIAVYRSGTWYLSRSSAGFTGIAFGDGNDIPQPADFDGDGKAEIAVWRPSNGTWYAFNLVNNQFTAYQFGASTDKPVVGDYDGDGKADYAVYRPSNGTWYLQRSTAGFTGMQFGDANDKPVAADYDGDGKTDVAVFRPSNGVWYLNRSTAGFTSSQFGVSTDLPTPADYDGDGKADIAVFRSGTWYLNRSTAGFLGIAFGAATDKPVPNAFVP